MDRWENIPTTDINTLKDNPRYPNNPDVTETVTRFLWDGADLSDYGARIEGWLYAPTTGEYTFWLACDDQGELWLSTDDDSNNAEMIAYVKDSPTATGGWFSSGATQVVWMTICVVVSATAMSLWSAILTLSLYTRMRSTSGYGSCCAVLFGIRGRHSPYPVASVEEMGFMVYLANSRDVKAIAHAKVKNDRVDARVLCDLLRGGLLPESHRSSRSAREWKELVRFRTSLIGMRTQVKNKIHALLSRNGIIPPIGMIFGKCGRVWLSGLSLSPLHRRHLDQYLSLLDHYEEEITLATKAVEQHAAESKDAALLMSIPGVSFVSALSILSEIDTIARFGNGKQIASYAGLVPTVYASGESVRYGRLSKRGSKMLRTILVEVAHAQGRLRRSTGLRPYFERIKAKKGVRTATVATARKLCVVVYHILSSKDSFDDTRLVA